MNQALIGHTGFVGGVLAANDSYSCTYNSKNIEDIGNKSFDRIVCSGVSAVKWKANADPAADLAGIERLKRSLEQVEAEAFVLVSTVDVYPSPRGVDENALLNRAAGQPYGRHRLELEDWVLRQFSNVLVIRLPALFGPGLKKNVLFDMMSNNQVDKINGASSFQWYDLSWLNEHIKIAENSKLNVVNLSVEPILTSEIQERIFPNLKLNSDPEVALHYDMKTIHAEVFGRNGPYLKSSEECLAGMTKFVEDTRLCS